MKLDARVKLWSLVLVALLGVGFFNTTAHADLDGVRRAIVERDARWTAGENPVTRLSPEEMRRRLTGTILAHDPDGSFDYKSFVARSDLPTSFSWQDNLGHDWITPVKDQASCGSCWAFAGVGALEAIVRIRTDDPFLEIDLSEQFLVSCSPGSCSGGYAGTAMSFLKSTGAPDEACYPYAAANLPCSRACDDWGDRKHRIAGWSYVPNRVESIKAALIQQPLNTTMMVYGDLPYYEGGVYERTTDQILGGHAVVLVGWEDDNACWIVKNSWGGEWGEEGFFRIKWGDSDIGDFTGFQEYCLDRDRDGYSDVACGGDDCDDLDPAIRPCATELCGNGIDEDCIGGDRSCDVLQEVDPNDLPQDALVLDTVGSAVVVTGAVCRTGNDGYEYTGDVDHYRITVPARQGLQGEAGPVANILLDWAGTGNLDLRIYEADGVTQVAHACGSFHPEAVSNITLTAGADYILQVAGQRGDPAEYELRICYGACLDGDGDGFTDRSCCGSDCDDGDPDRGPAVEELICDGVDDDCDGGYNDSPDSDGDGFDACDPGEAGDLDGLDADCDDRKPGIRPDAEEVCDRIDNDCDGDTDEGLDTDGDGFSSCLEPVDCDDGDGERYPGAEELCNGIDDDCDGVIPRNEIDLDGDLYVACAGWNGEALEVLGGGDCDETRTACHPGARERLDLLDNDCDGDVDEGFGEEPPAETPAPDPGGEAEASDGHCGCAHFGGEAAAGPAAAAGGLWLLAPLGMIWVLRRRVR